jgi:prepilin-type N-terminal cleavage/methylation domain-containing protein
MRPGSIWSRLGQAGRRLRADESGFSLPELLVTIILGVIVFGIPGALWLTDRNTQTNIQSRATATQDAETMLERMTREMRQATSATVLNSQVIDLVVPIVPVPAAGNTLQRVRYDCSQNQSCTRDTGTVGGGLTGSPKTVMTNITNTDIFSATTTPSGTVNYIGIKLDKKLVVHGSTTSVELTDGVSLRNVT